VVWLRIPILWDVTLCSCISGFDVSEASKNDSYTFSESLSFEDGLTTSPYYPVHNNVPIVLF